MERILAAHHKIIGCGETHNFRHDFKIKETCTCDQVVDLCPVWGLAFKRFSENEKDVDSISLFRFLSKSAGEEILFLCDASKSTWGNMLRPYRLSKNYDVYLVHLTRNGEDCSKSMLKKKEQISNIFYKVFKNISVAIHWSLANLIALVFRFYKPRRYFRIKYENLISRPEKPLERLFLFLSLDGKEVIDLLENKGVIPLTHQLSGNIIRHQKDLRLQTDLKKSDLSVSNKLVFRIISWPIMKVLGY